MSELTLTVCIKVVKAGVRRYGKMQKYFVFRFSEKIGRTSIFGVGHLLMLKVETQVELSLKWGGGAYNRLGYRRKTHIWLLAI